MFKRIMLILFLLILMLYMLPVRASADGSTTHTGSSGEEHGGTSGSFYDDPHTADEYIKSNFYSLGKFLNGEMDYNTLTERFKTSSERFLQNTIDDNGKEFANDCIDKMKGVFDYVGETVTKMGDGASDFLDNLFSDFFDDYEVLRDVPTFDLHGGVAVVREYYSDRSYVDSVFNDTFYLQLSGSFLFGNCTPNSFIAQYKYFSNGSLRTDVGQNPILYDPPTSLTFQTGATCLYDGSYKFFGDVRMVGNEDFKTDDGYVTVPEYDFSTATDNDLLQLLNDLFEEIKRMMPDLSSIEGILQAIYYQTTGINSKMLTYDQCNALIMSLIASGDANTSEIVNALAAIREDLKDLDQSGTDDKEGEGDKGEEGGEVSGEETNKKEIAGTLYNVKPLDKNFLQDLITGEENLRVEYEGEIYYLEDDGTLELNGKYYYVDMNYDEIYNFDVDFSNDTVIFDSKKYTDFDFTDFNAVYAKLTVKQKDIVDGIVDNVVKLVTRFVPYSVIQSFFPMYEGIIFDVSTPQDVVLHFNGTEEIPSFDVTVLSVSFFDNEYVSQAMLIVRPFLTCILVYSWLRSMRKKTASMLGG